jgi:hypothetical protein
MAYLLYEYLDMNEKLLGRRVGNLESAIKKPAGLAGFATGSTLIVPLNRVTLCFAEKRPSQISASMPHRPLFRFSGDLRKYTLIPPRLLTKS